MPHYIKEKINNIYFQTTQREESGQISDKKEIVMTGNHFIDHCRKFRIVEFGRQTMFEHEARFEFHTEPQPVFNKNFELLSEKLLSNDQKAIQHILSQKVNRR